VLKAASRRERGDAQRSRSSTSPARKADRQAGRNEEIPPIWGTSAGLRLNEYIRSAFRVSWRTRERKAIWRGKSESIRTRQNWGKMTENGRVERGGGRGWGGEEGKMRPIVLCLKPRAILMRRTCYMEWNKELAGKGAATGSGTGGRGWHRGSRKKSGVERNTKEGHTRLPNLRPRR